MSLYKDFNDSPFPGPTSNHPSSRCFMSVKEEHYFVGSERAFDGKSVSVCVLKLNNLMVAFLLEQKWHMLLLITW